MWSIDLSHSHNKMNTQKKVKINTLMAAVPAWFIEALNESHLRNVIKLLAHQQQLWASPFREILIHTPDVCYECMRALLVF